MSAKNAATAGAVAGSPSFNLGNAGTEPKRSGSNTTAEPEKPVTVDQTMTETNTKTRSSAPRRDWLPSVFATGLIAAVLLGFTFLQGNINSVDYKIAEVEARLSKDIALVRHDISVVRDEIAELRKSNSAVLQALAINRLDANHPTVQEMMAPTNSEMSQGALSEKERGVG